MRYTRRRMVALALLGLGAGLGAEAAAAKGKRPARPRYYFAIGEIRSDQPVDEALRTAAKEVLVEDLAARPEFTADVGEATGDALVAELKRRKLKGFSVGLKLVEISREPRPPRPGKRLPQLAVGVKVAVFGTTLEEKKLAFGGEGEAQVEAEIVAAREEQEAAALTRDALVQAVRQAVDQAVGKLELKPSKPFNESKRRRAVVP